MASEYAALLDGKNKTAAAISRGGCLKLSMNVR